MVIQSWLDHYRQRDVIMSTSVSFNSASHFLRHDSGLGGVFRKDGQNFKNDFLEKSASGVHDFCPVRPEYFSGSDLYENGTPKPADIRQDSLGDCYFVSAAGAIAQQDPQAIKNAISYDESTRSFNVTMYKEEFGFNPLGWGAAPVTVNVTQDDLKYNLERQGGSTIDNNVCKDGAAWPMVMETAYAKLRDSNHQDGLQEGFDKIGNGGWPGDAMFSITGRKSHTVSFDEGISPFAITREMKQNAVHDKVSDALRSGKPVTLSVHGESEDIPGKEDDLADVHTYMVTDIRKDADGESWVKVRNPWGHNNDGEGSDSVSAEIEINLKDLHDAGTASGSGAWGFEIGG